MGAVPKGALKLGGFPTDGFCNGEEHPLGAGHELLVGYGVMDAGGQSVYAFADFLLGLVEVEHVGGVRLHAGAKGIRLDKGDGL